VVVFRGISGRKVQRIAKYIRRFRRPDKPAFADPGEKKMNVRFKSVASTLTLLGLAAAAQAATVGTVSGVYDSTNNANAVDFSAAYTLGFAGGSTPITSANVVTVGQFSPLLTAANGIGLGGVMDFDVTTENTVESTELRYRYGLGGEKSISFNSLTGYSGVIATNGTARTPVSGSRFLNKYLGGSFQNDYGYTIGTPTGTFLPETVVALGFTVLSRSTSETSGIVNFGNVVATVELSDGSLIQAARTINELSGAGDTFYGFVAPTGLSINSFTIDIAGTANFAGLDDVAFITVPEPTAFAALGLGGLLLGRRRRAN
jgi:hypothetical protein